MIEEVIGRWSAAVLGSVVLSGHLKRGRRPMVLGSGTDVSHSQRDPARPPRTDRLCGPRRDGRHRRAHLLEALGYLRPRLRAMRRWTHFAQPALAGLMVGCIGYFGFPQVMGPGYGVIDQAMHGQFAWKMLLALGLLKILATTLSFTSGTPGGMFAPTLFIGAMLGASVGSFEKMFFPHFTGAVGSYALVGMGVLFAGFLRAPLTSVFMVLEVSGNYSIILPVILANTIAYLLARSLQPVPIFEVFTHQDGLDLPSMEEQREEIALHLEDALRPIDVPIVQDVETLASASATLEPSSPLPSHSDLGWLLVRHARRRADQRHGGVYSGHAASESSSKKSAHPRCFLTWRLTARCRISALAAAAGA